MQLEWHSLKETAEQVTSAHPACLVLSDDGPPGW